MRCQNCHLTIPPTVKFCIYWGTGASIPVPASRPTGQRGGIGAYVAAHKFRTFAVVLITIVGFFAIVLVAAGQFVEEPPTDNPTRTEQPPPSTLMQNREQGSTGETGVICAPASPADVMEHVLPSVVQVLTNEGSGSGFIVSDTGLVVTNRHVVEGSRRMNVRLTDGRQLRATIAELHSSLDLAYLEVTSSRVFTPIAIGDSDEIRVGERVIAIGFPLGSDLGSDPSITQGIISAKREGFLQTDASLNPGNSGGPLLDDLGNVIGVNTAGIREADGEVITGINFAIPINDVRRSLRGQITPGQPFCEPAAATVPITPTPVPDSTAVHEQPTSSPAPTPTVPQPTATPQPPPQPTATPRPTPRPTATRRPTPRPTATRRPTPRPTTTPRPTPRPTTTPRPTPRPTSTPTPMPTLTPTPPRVGLIHEDTSFKYKINYEQSWTIADGHSAGGRPFLNVTVEKLDPGDSFVAFFERHNSELLDAARNHIFNRGLPFLEPGKTGSGKYDGLYSYRSREYRWQPDPAGCIYHVVERIFRSWYFPDKRFAFIITVGICEDEIPFYSGSREAILESFEEYQ